MSKIKILALAFIIQISMVFSCFASENIYDELNKNASTRSVNFEISASAITATTDVKNVTKNTTLTLVLAQYEDDIVTKVKTDKKAVTSGGDAQISCSLTYVEGAIYKAYLWNPTALAPYTNVATYSSDSIEMSYFKIGENDFTSLENSSYDLVIPADTVPQFLAKPQDNGTNISVALPDSYPGTAKVTVTSSDKSVTKTINFNISVIQSSAFYNWLDEMIISRDAVVTIYTIE